MKTIIYNMDGKKVLNYLVLKSNPDQKAEVTKTIEEMDKTEKWESVTIKVEIDEGKKSYCNTFIDNNTGVIYYDHCKLPISIRTLYNIIFNKLYWKYCN